MKLPSGSFTSHGYRRKPFFCQPVFHMIFPHGHRWSIRKQSPVEVFHGWPHEQLISNGLELRYSKNQSKANKKLYYCSNKQFMLPTRTAYVSSKIAIGVLWPSPFLAGQCKATGRCTACRSQNEATGETFFFTPAASCGDWILRDESLGWSLRIWARL